MSPTLMLSLDDALAVGVHVVTGVCPDRVHARVAVYAVFAPVCGEDFVVTRSALEVVLTRGSRPRTTAGTPGDETSAVVEVSSGKDAYNYHLQSLPEAGFRFVDEGRN